MRHWTRERGGHTYYASLGSGGLTIGDHHGSGQSDNAGHCTLDEFLAGQYHDLARRDLGPTILAEMIAAGQALRGT